MSDYSYYYEDEFLEDIEIYILKEKWDKAYDVLQEYLKYYSTKKSTLCEYIVNLILSLKDKGYIYNYDIQYLSKDKRYSCIIFNLNEAYLTLCLFLYTIIIDTSKLNKGFKITPFIYRTFKSLLEFSYTHQSILVISKESQLIINPLANRLGYNINATTLYFDKFVRIEKKSLSLIDIYIN